MTISVITPAYNAADFITDAIQSLLSQSVPNWELIIVDDGSSDKTYDVANSLALKDSRIKVFRQPNQGPSAARANGIKHASGEWITFLDADDCLEPTAIETFTLCAESGQSDVYIYSHHDGWKYIPQIISASEYKKASLMQDYCTGPVCKLFRHTLFTNNIFEMPSILRSGEDWLMNIRLSFNLVSSASFRKEIVYICRNNVNPQSLMKTHRSSWEYTNMFYSEFLNSVPSEYHSEFSDEIAYNLSNAYHQQWRKRWVLPPEAHSSYIYKQLKTKFNKPNALVPLFNRLEYNTTFPPFRMTIDLFERIAGFIRRRIHKPTHKYYTA